MGRVVLFKYILKKSSGKFEILQKIGGKSEILHYFFYSFRNFSSEINYLLTTLKGLLTIKTQTNELVRNRDYLLEIKSNVELTK